MEARILRCRICGEVYFGKHPSHCPFCGVHQKFLISITAWREENKNQNIEDENDKKILTEAIGLEYSNTRLYIAASKNAQREDVAGYFKYLSKVELEHYEVFTKLLSVPMDETIKSPSQSKGGDLENLKESSVREARAQGLYTRFARDTKNPRLKEVFRAISEVEGDHLKLDRIEIKKLEGNKK